MQQLLPSKTHLIKALLFLLIFIASIGKNQAQERFKISKGSIEFSSDAPLELIEASSSSLRGLIDTSSNKFAFAIKIPSFDGFNSALQRQHFNENYMESEKYPEATFTGKIIEEIDYSQDGTYKARAKGKLTVHGIAQTRLFRVSMEIKEGKIYIKAELQVPLEDHNITIPSIVSQKIATEINVTVVATLTKD